MKGTVVSTWMKTCKKLYGEKVVCDAMEASGWSRNRVFSPMEDVKDLEVNKVINRIADINNVTLKELWKSIGRDNIISFSENFPAFFKHENLYSFLSVLLLFHLHQMITLS